MRRQIRSPPSVFMSIPEHSVPVLGEVALKSSSCDSSSEFTIPNLPAPRRPSLPVPIFTSNAIISKRERRTLGRRVPSTPSTPTRLLPPRRHSHAPTSCFSRVSAPKIAGNSLFSSFLPEKKTIYVPTKLVTDFPTNARSESRKLDLNSEFVHLLTPEYFLSRIDKDSPLPSFPESFPCDCCSSISQHSYDNLSQFPTPSQSSPELSPEFEHTIILSPASEAIDINLGPRNLKRKIIPERNVKNQNLSSQTNSPEDSLCSFLSINNQSSSDFKENNPNESTKEHLKSKVTSDSFIISSFKLPVVGSDPNEDYVHKNFQTLDLLGGGSYSKVVRVARIDNHSGVYALKTLKCQYTTAAFRLRQLEEVKTWYEVSRARHRNIAHLFGAWEQKCLVNMLSELCAGGTLKMFLSSNCNTHLPDKIICDIISDIVCGLAHLHSLGIAHLDLKPANILRTAQGLHKLADFGISYKVPEKCFSKIGDSNQLSSITLSAPIRRFMDDDRDGDHLYLAPEALAGELTLKTDIFAVGLILLEMISNAELPDRDLPYDRLRCGDISDFISELPFDHSKTLVTLVRSCLSPVSCLRPSVQQIIVIPIIAEAIESRFDLPSHDDPKSYTNLVAAHLPKSPGSLLNFMSDPDSSFSATNSIVDNLNSVNNSSHALSDLVSPLRFECRTPISSAIPTRKLIYATLADAEAAAKEKLRHIDRVSAFSALVDPPKNSIIISDSLKKESSKDSRQESNLFFSPSAKKIESNIIIINKSPKALSKKQNQEIKPQKQIDDSPGTPSPQQTKAIIGCNFSDQKSHNPGLVDDSPLAPRSFFRKISVKDQLLASPTPSGELLTNISSKCTDKILKNPGGNTTVFFSSPPPNWNSSDNLSFEFISSSPTRNQNTKTKIGANSISCIFRSAGDSPQRPIYHHKYYEPDNPVGSPTIMLRSKTKNKQNGQLINDK